MSFQSWHARNLTNFDLSTWKSQKKFTLVDTFWAKYKLFAQSTEKLSFMKLNWNIYKIWRGIDLLKNCYKKFDKFWPQHSKVSKIFTLMGSFSAKYILFELKKYRGVIFHESEEGYNVWRGIYLSFQNWRIWGIWENLTQAL